MRSSYRPTFQIYHWQLCNVLDPETRRNEARRPESGDEVLVWGQRAPSHQLVGLGERCKSAVSSPRGIQGGAPENLDFGPF